jgi:hypothetical protein
MDVRAISPLTPRPTIRASTYNYRGEAGRGGDGGGRSISQVTRRVIGSHARRLQPSDYTLRGRAIDSRGQQPTVLNRPHRLGHGFSVLFMPVTTS